MDSLALPGIDWDELVETSGNQTLFRIWCSATATMRLVTWQGECIDVQFNAKAHGNSKNPTEGLHSIQQWQPIH